MGIFRWLADIFEPILPPPIPTDFELPSPGYWLKDDIIDNLTITKESLNVLLDESPKVWKTTVADTNSLDTFIDYRHTVILIAGNNDRDHQRILDWIIPGDIVVYDSSLYKYPIIHRVIEISSDGISTKGDNNRKTKTHLGQRPHHNFPCKSSKLEGSILKFLLQEEKYGKYFLYLANSSAMRIS